MFICRPARGGPGTLAQRKLSAGGGTRAALDFFLAFFSPPAVSGQVWTAQLLRKARCEQLMQRGGLVKQTFSEASAARPEVTRPD
jgi:hypothetical protein